MHIILGGTGHVGSATAEALLKRGEAVTVVVRDAEKAQDLRRNGAEVAVADIHNSDALREILHRGKRLYALNPPASPDGDTDRDEKQTIAAILAAIEGSGLEKIVGHSTYGAQKGEAIGDLGTLFELEEGLKRQPIPASILRAAYYMTNWDMSLETAKSDGVLNTFFPADFRLAMVAPRDLGEAAAELMTEPAEKTRLVYAEGPKRYSSADVAAALADLLKKPVKVSVTPRDRWEATYRSLGFSELAAKSHADMTALALESPMPAVIEVRRGTMALHDYLAALVSTA